MMNDTKKCPYCGEEILVTAKKCKYCGEWLEEIPAKETEITSTTSVINASRKERIDHLTTPVAKYAYWLFLLGIFALLVSLAYQFEDLRSDIGSGRMRIFNWVLIQVRTYIPEWIGTFASGIVESIFLGGLLIGLKGHSIPMEKSLIALIIPTALSSFADFIPNVDTAIAIFFFIGCIAIILNTIVAIRLLVHYEGQIAKLGIFMLCNLGVGLLNGLDLFEGWLMPILVGLVYVYVSIIYLKIWRNLLSEE